ncbi:MAG: hypothetical protein F6K39_18045 [Okeania sp. SIO3B3]|nr:hypothetical protein [Okeania sp. SIO3B3]
MRIVSLTKSEQKLLSALLQRNGISIQQSAISYQLLILRKIKATFEIEERIKVTAMRPQTKPQK